MPQKLQLRRSRLPSGKVKGYIVVETIPSPQPLHTRKGAPSTTASMSSRNQFRDQDREPEIGLSKRDRYSGNHRRGNDYYDEFEIDSYARARSPRSTRDMETRHRSSVSNGPKYFDDEQDQPLRSRDFNIQLHRKPINNGIPFGKAMRKLHKQLERAYRFYEDFKNQFENEVGPIRVYADDQILDELWAMKVQGRSSPRRCTRTSSGFHNDSDDDDLLLERPAMRFVMMRKKIVEALGTALHSDINASGGSSQSKKSAGRHDSIVRLHGKVVTANEQIKSLLFAAAETSENCDGLLHELQMLKDLVDPDIEKNRALYRGSGDEEDEGDDREHEAF